MSTTDTPKDGGPAFPPNAGWRDNDPSGYGMTLRDWFAGTAIAALLSTVSAQRQVQQAVEEKDDGVKDRTKVIAEVLAKRAYGLADAMLQQRLKQTK